MAERFDGRVAAFPEVAKPESFGFREAPPHLMDFAPADVMWTTVSPPVAIEVDGSHTGSDRAADDEFAVDAEAPRGSRRPTPRSPWSTRWKTRSTRAAWPSATDL
jgi:hypothetical protein